MKSIARMFLCLIAVCMACLPYAAAQEAAVDVTVSGTVRDRVSQRSLENVTVSLAGTSVGTVTNADGFFSLKIPHGSSARYLELSYVGYINTRISASYSPDGVIWMIPATNQLDEAVIYGGDARRIVEDALERVPDNYSSSENLLSVFYRETVQKGARYIGISEAMMDVYKTDYSYRGIYQDRVRLTKARRLLSQKASDTLSVKVAGGPNLSLNLDFVKNPDLLFDRETIWYYEFVQEPSVIIGDRPQYVIRFMPMVSLDHALFAGRLFIDREWLSFTRAEFSLDLSDRDKAVSSILRKKPAGLRFRPLEVNFLVSYRERDGVSYMNYVCNEIRFRCDWKRRLFSSAYTARAEMVVVDNAEHPERPFAYRDAFKSNDIFYDVVDDYWHEDFWKDYNIIEPTETLENAVRRLMK